MLTISMKYYIMQKNDEIMSKTGIVAREDLEDAAEAAIEYYGEYAYGDLVTWDIDEVYSAIDAVADKYLNEN